MMNRKIIHIDMDAFYASVEVRDNPSLAGKPVIIGALPGTRGVVSTCSYEARRFGVRSAMSITEAYKRCPQGIFLKPSGHKYVAESEKIHKIMASYTDIIEYVSLDEGYMDVTASIKLFGSAENIGRELKRRVFEETGLTCSVGVGYSKTSAKTASEEKKPDGFFVIPNPEFFVKLIKDREIGVLHGIGKKTAERLYGKGIVTVDQLISLKEGELDFLGILGREILLHARGIDDRPVIPNQDAKSVGKEYTFQSDLTDKEEMDGILHFISRQVSYQLKSNNQKGKTITLKIKFSDMKQITRSKTGEYTNSAKKICQEASELLFNTEVKKPVRLIGVSVSNMEQGDGARQMSFDDFIENQENEKQEKLDNMIFEINKNMGKGALKTGKEILAEQSFKKRREK